MSACVPDTIKEQLNETISAQSQMISDASFKSAIAQIELHKVRFGNYPNTLAELKFLSQMDSNFLEGVTYLKLDSGYELNLKENAYSLGEVDFDSLKKNYPPEFWKGLGCVKSNLK
jgi:hypothetical protein